MGPHGLTAWPHPAAISPSGQALVIPQPMYPSPLHAMSPVGQGPAALQHGLSLYSHPHYPLYAGMDPTSLTAAKASLPGYPMTLSLMHMWADMAKLNAT